MAERQVASAAQGVAGSRGQILITGTDTGVGKTRVTAGLTAALAQRGVVVAAVKPLVSGAWFPPDGSGPVWEDVLALEEAGGVVLPDALRSPVRLHQPAAPLFAAQAEGREIHLAEVLQQIDAAAARARITLVEGVGGWRVPFAPGLDTADLAVALGAPVILVVGLRLGCINHALLTAEAIRARGLWLAGWVANSGVDPGYAPAVPDTLHVIEAALGLRCAASLPQLAAGSGASAEAPASAIRAELRAQAQEAAASLGPLADQLMAMFHVKQR